MNRTWTVCRQFSQIRDAERPWDQAYQLLVRQTGQDGLPSLAASGPEPTAARTS